MNRRVIIGVIIIIVIMSGAFFIKSSALGYGVVVIELKGTSVDCPCNVIVSFTYPGAPKDQFYKLERLPATIKFEFQEELAVMEQDYKRLYSNAKGASIVLPTIMVVIYDRHGNTVKFLYNTLSYYQEPDRARELEKKGLTPWMASLMDPFKPFREGFKITVDLDKIGMVKDPRFNDEPPRTITGISQGCEPTLTLPYWSELYDERYNPPNGWVSHIVGEDWKARSAWYMFAVKYGSAYYYRTDLYSKSDALAATQRMLGFGEGSMDELLNRLGYPELTWSDVMNKYESVYLEVPWISATFYTAPEYEYKFMALATLQVSKVEAYTQGWSFRGTLVSGVSKQTPIDILESVGINTNGTARIVVPQVYVYLGNGYVVDYEVNRVYVGSCSYWEVVPYTLFTPRYLVIDLFGQYYGEVCIGGCDNTRVAHALAMLQYSTTLDVLLDDIVNVTAGTPIVHDTTAVSSGYEISGSIVNIYKEWIEFLLELILSRYNPVYRYMVGLFMDQFSYTYYIYNDGGVEHIMKLYPSIDQNGVYIRVEKYMGNADVATSAYSDLVPLHIDYKVYIGMYPSLPCQSYCPRG